MAPPTKGTTSVTISQQELESRLWDAAIALRGPVDPADFKNYVFPMLFWKWISDTWAYEHELALSEYGDDLDEEVESDFHRFEMPEGTLWSVATKKVKNLGAEIAKTFQRIEKANPRSLAGVFGDAAWGNKERIPESALLGLIRAFNQIKLDPSTVSHDLLGAGYEYLLKNFADESGKKAGEFFTPREVVNLLVGILEPKPGESVYDPACGSGGMLVATINQLREANLDHRTLRLYGQEINLTTSSIARMNLFLHEIEDFDIKRGDTLRAPAFKNRDGSVRQFDAVIANPPFSLKNWGADRWASDPRARFGLPPAKNGDFAFIEHMVASMKPGTGRAGVVMPHGALSRGESEAKIRQGLVTSNLLEAVIGLPPNLFYSTTIPACLLIFRSQKRVGFVNHVLFVDGSSYDMPAKTQNVMSSDHIDSLVSAYREGASLGDHSIARLVPFSEIENNEYNLSIGRYIKTAVDQPETDLESLVSAYYEAKASRESAQEKMLHLLSSAGIEGFHG